MNIISAINLLYRRLYCHYSPQISSMVILLSLITV